MWAEIERLMLAPLATVKMFVERLAIYSGCRWPLRIGAESSGHHDCLK